MKNRDILQIVTLNYDIPSGHNDKTDGESDPEFNPDEYPLIRVLTNGVTASLLIIAGIFANVIVITRWLRDRVRWPALYYYFLAFASWNLTLLVCTLFFYSIPALLRQPASKSTLAYVPYFYVSGYVGGNCCLTAVVWLMVILTVERFLAVAVPFHNLVTSPRRRAKVISISLSVLAILYNTPLMFEFRIAHSEIISKNGNHGYWVVETAPFRSNFYYQTVYRVVLNLLFTSLTPFLAISLLTCNIALVIKRANVQRATYSRRATLSITSNGSFCQRSNATTSTSAYGNILLTLFVIKFLVFYSIPFALNVSELFVPAEAFDTEVMRWATDISDFLVILDSVSNAFLYSSWRKRIGRFKRRTPAGSSSVDERRRNSSYCDSSTRRKESAKHSLRPPDELQLKRLVSCRDSVTTSQ